MQQLLLLLLVTIVNGVYVGRHVLLVGRLVGHKGYPGGGWAHTIWGYVYSS